MAHWLYQLKGRQLVGEALESKNKQLTTYALQLAQKNGALHEMRDKVVQTRKQMKSQSGAQQLQQLLVELDRVNNSDADWNEFKLHFEAVHTDFFKELKVRVPELTSNDLRMCALLRLNLSTKEMANILHLSPKSVEVARYRLRKKLGLQHGEELVSWMIAVA